MAKPLVLIFGLFGVFWQVVSGDSKYDNYTLMKITPHNEKHFEALVKLAVLRTAEVDFLKKSYGVNDTADVLVSPDRVKDLEEFVHRHKMPVKYKYNYGRCNVLLLSNVPFEVWDHLRVHVASFKYPKPYSPLAYVGSMGPAKLICFFSCREVPISERDRNNKSILSTLIKSQSAGSLELISIQRRFKGSLNDYHILPYNSNRFNSYDRFLYNSYDAITKYINTLRNRVPDLVEVKNLGFSYEKRMMQLVKISTDPHAGNPVIFIDAGVHAREWVAPAMAMYLIHRLTSDPTARTTELNGVDWYILPVVNPDGYEYSREYDRMWRKTRSQHSERPHCVGVDGNRNYGFKWGGTGASRNPCDEEVYAGPWPLSEVETQMVSKIMMQYKDRIKLYVTLHAYGQYLVYPWGYTSDILPKQWKKLHALARQVSGSVKRAGGRPFKVMSSGKWYVSAGGSDDYAFGAAGIPYSYTMELTDGYEFFFPERHLPTVMPRFYEGFKTFSAQIKMEFSNYHF